ncbi:MAG: antibiotic biosynthesis monooxygenase [Sphingomonadaceae bacterium]|nr:antibiotic biosynthesis monooxygenase [Sphingomonadaceae bacterium]
MIVVTGSFRLPAENLDAAIPAMKRVIAASLEERGCLAYAYSVDIVDPGLIRVTEAWANGETLAQHFNTPHMQTWQQEREALGMTDRTITMHAVKHSTDL